MKKNLIKQEKYGGEVGKAIKSGSGLASVLQATSQSKYGFKFKNTRLSFTFGHDGLLASIPDNIWDKWAQDGLFQPRWAPSHSSWASLAAAKLESWMFFIWDRQQLFMVMILSAICNVFQLLQTSNLILIILIIFIFRRPTEVPDKTHNDSAWTPPNANLTQTHWCNWGFALSPVIFHCKHKWIYCKGLLMQTQRSSLLMSQGQHGGAPNARHSERRAPVSLTVRASCRGQTVVGKLRACCAVMFC